MMHGLLSAYVARGWMRSTTILLAPVGWDGETVRAAVLTAYSLLAPVCTGPRAGWAAAS